MDNVIELGDIKIRAQTIRQAKCRHLTTILDPVGRIVTCKNCEKQLDSFWVLERALSEIVKAREENKRSREILKVEHEEFNKKHRWLKVVKNIERAWRGPTKMAVSCPHCKAGILPEDGLGEFQYNPSYELKRREKANVQNSPN